MIGTSLAHYRLEAELGRGGMGVVYRARDTRLERVVALKMPKAGDVADRERLLREARMASALNHPNICTIHEVNEADGQPYIAMEFCEGRPLSALISTGTLPLETAVRYATQIAGALAHAHGRGVIHRDLKSSNVMVTPDGRCKVLDFGLAQREVTGIDAATRSRISAEETSGVSGTLHYLAPEVLRGNPSDARSDIWAFGVLLYEMLAGQLPFRGATAFEISSAILRESPASLPANILAGLRGIIQRCLEKEPAQRYANAGEVSAALEAASLDSSGQVPLQKTDAASRGRRIRRAVMLTAGIVIALAALAAFNLRGRLLGTNPTRKIQSLAILPFRPLAGDAGDDAMGMGIADTLITKVSQIGELRVRPSSAVRKYAGKEVDALQAAKELQADAVLDAAWQRSGDRIRINVNLLRASDGSSLWSESFNQNFTDIFELQDQIAQKVAEGLRVNLTASERAKIVKRHTSNPQAYEYFLAAQESFEHRSVRQGAEVDTTIRMCLRAIELDPQYALAHAQLAYAYAWKGLFIDIDQPSWREKAEAELNIAESLDASLAEVHVVRHELWWSAEANFNIDAAIRELQRAQQLDANVGHQQLGILYAHMGLERAAERELSRAMELDPNAANQAWYMEAFDLVGDADGAIAAYNKAPEGAGTFMRKSFMWKKDFDKAEQIIRHELAKDPEDWFAQSNLLLLGAVRGNFQAAETQMPGIMQRAQRSRGFHHIAYIMASVYALQGKAPQAVEWLRKTVAFGMPNCTLFSRDSHLDKIRQSTKYVQFIGELQPRCDAYAREFEK